MEGTGMAVTGDAVSVYYPHFPVLVPTTPPPSFDLDQTLASIERIRSFAPSKLLTPHLGEIGDAEKVFNHNARILLHWDSILRRLSAEGQSAAHMAEALIRDVCERAGRPASELPEHLRASIRVDVLGFVRYLSAK
jgi:glyoxylase-like metal-dependent hydrolase (beta-lactamase superfamily II)